MEKALQNLGYFFVWLDPKDGWLPWFEHNQGLLSVAALVLAGTALWWEANKARRDAADATAARAEAASKEHQALIYASRKDREARVVAKQNETVFFCMTLESSLQALRLACQKEKRRLEALPPKDRAGSGEFVQEGFLVHQAVQMLMNRPPLDREAVLACSHVLRLLDGWHWLEGAFDASTMIDLISDRANLIQQAEKKLREAREAATFNAQGQITDIWAGEPA